MGSELERENVIDLFSKIPSLSRGGKSLSRLREIVSRLSN